MPPGDAHLLTETFLRYSMLDRLVSHLRASGDRAGPDARRRAAELLASRGEWSKSIVALNWYETTGGAFTADVARLRYPEAFPDEFDAAIRVEPVDPWVFYALVREESLFDSVVASGAGAVGLAQLMPSTAADIAGRLRLTGYDLTSASDSVRIGARYFGMLTDQFGTPARALAAYNAGQGNVRRWERLWPYADDLLFHQMIPFPETYNHVRKVVVSAAYYGFLYADRTPADTVRLVFGLAPPGHLSGARDIDR